MVVIVVEEIMLTIISFIRSMYRNMCCAYRKAGIGLIILFMIAVKILKPDKVKQKNQLSVLPNGFLIAQNEITQIPQQFFHIFLLLPILNYILAYSRVYFEIE